MKLTGTATPSVDKITALRQSELFHSLSEPLLRQIATLAISRQLNRGQLLFSERDEASGIYVVIRGELRSIRQSPDGREQVLSTEREGATLAVSPVFDGGKFHSTVIADTNAEVLCISKRDIHQLCREHTQILWNIARILAHKVRHYAELVETLALRNVEQRLAQHLLTIAQQRGVGVGNSCTFEMTLTRTEIASRLGTVREVISRAFTHLQGVGLIRLDGQRLVTIPNMQAMRHFAGTEHQLPEAKMVSDISSDMV
jgi:CRP/FNR family transcriptional regulator